MLVLHGWWRHPEGLGAWAETGAADAAQRPARRGRVTVPPHPCAADTLDVTDALGLPMGTPSGHAVLTLPTRGGVPEPSPEVGGLDVGAFGAGAFGAGAFRAGAPGPGARAALTLAPWRVPVVLLDGGAAALRVLGAPPPDGVPDKRLVDGGAADSAVMDGGVVQSGSWRVLRELAAFADDLAARGRVVPQFADGEAVWRPVLTGSDAAWARALVLALPPSARAGDQSAGQDVAAACLDGLVDAAVRQRIAGRAPVPDPADWWSALHPGSAQHPGSSQHPGSALNGWLREGFAGSARARFRLTEPPDEQDLWRLDISLQAVDSPSVVVPAARVWKGEVAGGAAGGGHLGDAPARTLLTELGRATRLVPALEPALRTARPTGLDLDADGAHAFLTRGAADLAAAGFGVDLPSWWGRASARVGLRLSTGSPAQPGVVAGTSRLGQQALVDYRWDLAIGDTVLSAEELTALAALQQPLVRVRGQWVELDVRRLQAGIALMEKAKAGPDGDPAGQLSVADLIGLLGSGEGPAGLPLVDVETAGWLRDLLDGDPRRLAPAPTPAGFHGTLRPYQERGLAWLTFLDQVGLGGVLADDMGLGKTVQLLALLAGDPRHDERPAGVGPTLLVCPMSLVGNWQREAARFTPGLAVHVHHGAERARGAAFDAAVADADLVLTTYALVSRDVDDLREIGWRRVVLDEAQAVKNAATRQSTAVRSLPSAHRLAVTGTPVENRLADLWSLMDFANPGLLGSAARFRERFAVPVERHGDEAAADRLKAVTRPFVLRRLKTDKTIIADLPDKFEMEVVCSLTAEQAALYRAVVDDMLAKVDDAQGIERRGLVLATMTKLKQVCNHPAQLLRDGSRVAGRSGKLARLEETLEEVLAAGEKALLFSQFAEFGSMLRAHLSSRFGREVLFLHGGVPKAERDAMVTRFQSDGSDTAPLFVLSLKAGGTGLTLTAANHVVHVDRWWNPAVEDQATDRAFRIGQTRNVQVRKLICAGTLEEKIAEMIRDKRGLAARIVGTGEGWLTELSTDDLRDLLRLEDGAVVE